MKNSTPNHLLVSLSFVKLGLGLCNKFLDEAIGILDRLINLRKKNVWGIELNSNNVLRRVNCQLLLDHHGTPEQEELHHQDQAGDKFGVKTILFDNKFGFNLCVSFHQGKKKCQVTRTEWIPEPYTTNEGILGIRGFGNSRNMSV